MANLDRCPSHRRSHYQFEHDICNLRSPAKHTCNNTKTYRYQMLQNTTLPPH